MSMMENHPQIEQEVKKPPIVKVGVIGWLRANLFSSWLNTLFTLILGTALFIILKGVIQWVFFSAKWAVVAANFKLIVVGQYPVAELWRVWLGLTLISLLFGLTWGIYRGVMGHLSMALSGLYLVLLVLPFVTTQTRIWLVVNIAVIYLGYLVIKKFPQLKKYTWIGWALSFPIAVFLLHGFGFLPEVKTNVWGGFLLTVLISAVSIVFSFPIGVLLALGRRSQLPVVRYFSIIYIELIRGVPLISVLFMAQLMLPLFLPEGITIDNVLRAMIGFTLFNAAYVAENVRGGLQSIPKGQFEAAQALGLNTPQMTSFIILPQALRAIIPATVGQVISVFKDTSLVAIVGLMDLLGIGKAIAANPQFLGTHMEMLIFVAFIFWLFSYSMSHASRRLEKSLGVGER